MHQLSHRAPLKQYFPRLQDYNICRKSINLDQAYQDIISSISIVNLRSCDNYYKSLDLVHHPAIFAGQASLGQQTDLYCFEPDSCAPDSFRDVLTLIALRKSANPLKYGIDLA